jgi:hypothetical protein
MLVRLLFIRHFRYPSANIIVEDEAPLVHGVAAALGMSFSNNLEEGQLWLQVIKN